MRTGFLIALGIVVGSTLSTVIAMAWTGPTASPPSGNVSAPINVGSANQIKNGSLGVSGLAVFGNSILQTSSYLNWGTIAGASGYGIRDNGGTLEFKNSGGSWSSIQDTVFSLTGGGSGTYLPLGGGTMASSATIDNAGRMHIASQENIYLLPRGGTAFVSNAWGGAGNLDVSGNATVRGSLGLNVQTVFCANGWGCDGDPSPEQVNVSCPSGYTVVSCSPSCYDTDSVRLCSSGAGASNTVCSTRCQAGGSHAGYPCDSWIYAQAICMRISDVGDN